MWKRLLVVLCSLGSHVVYGVGRSINRRISQVGSESGWRAAETNVAKVKPKSAASH